MRIILDGDGSLPEYKDRETIRGEINVALALPAGMQSGNPSVAFLIELPDGKLVFAETSLKIFLTAAAAFKGRYGHPE